MYKLKKDGAMWCVVTASGVVQFSSLRRSACAGWITDNTPSNTQ